MTVKELIEELECVENKDTPVFVAIGKRSIEVDEVVSVDDAGVVLELGL